MYVVGTLQARDYDGEFEDEDDAIDLAIALSYADNPIGVWHTDDLSREDRELVAIVYGQTVFRPED